MSGKVSTTGCKLTELVTTDNYNIFVQVWKKKAHFPIKSAH
jgi:hypothetical protein